jgi:hypothetical protein
MLDLGGNEIDCYVLGDGTRVLSSGSTTKAIADVDRGRLQDYIGQNALNPYINIDKILQEIIKFSMPGTQWPGLVVTGMWGRDEQETLRKLKEWNQPIHRVRGRIEKIFARWKRCYGLRRMRWRGLAKAAVQVHLTAIAYNLKRTLNIVQPAG